MSFIIRRFFGVSGILGGIRASNGLLLVKSWFLSVRPRVHGVVSESETQLERGVRQGS